MISSSVTLKAAAAAALLAVLLIRVTPPASAVLIWRCNVLTFNDNDQRLQCVYHLLENLLGQTPLKKGGWYLNEDCGDGAVIYGYRKAEQGSTGCLYETKFAIQRNCRHSTGAQAYGDDCYLRFEIYEFEV